jgi:hypothetical protein
MLNFLLKFFTHRKAKLEFPPSLQELKVVKVPFHAQTHCKHRCDVCNWVNECDDDLNPGLMEISLSSLAQEICTMDFRRKADQAWELAGCARVDGDKKDEAYYTNRARLYEQGIDPDETSTKERKERHA